MPSSVLVSAHTTASPEQGDRWISLPEVRRRLGGCATATVYRLMRRDPSFPRPVKLGVFNRWSERELVTWMDARLAARAAR